MRFLHRLSQLGASLLGRFGFGSQPEAVSAPMVRLNALLVGVATYEGTDKSPIRMTIMALNSEQIHCKCQQLLNEGTRLHLTLNFTGQDPLELKVVIDWVELSSYGHSLGLKVLHQGASRQRLSHQVEQFARNFAVHAQAG